LCELNGSGIVEGFPVSVLEWFVAAFLELETANACHFYGILQHFGLCSMLQLEAAILRNLLDCGLFQVGGCIYMYL